MEVINFLIRKLRLEIRYTNIYCLKLEVKIAKKNNKRTSRKQNVFGLLLPVATRNKKTNNSYILIKIKS